MSIELQALGVKCNIACSYCYQDPMREAGNENPSGSYNMEKMKAALLAEGVGGKIGFSFFGGEALLMPIADMEELCAWAQSHGIKPGLQTNGSLITDRHIQMFKKYGMSIGVSLDGPKKLNSAREAKVATATEKTTELSQKNLERLLSEKISCSLIVTLHKLNAASDELLEQLIAWLLDLRSKGLYYINLHPLEIDNERSAKLALTQKESIYAMRTLRKRLANFHVSPFSDMKAALLGQDEKSNCVWHACDPYTTSAVRGVDGQGNRGNCGRTNKDGVVYGKADRASHVRQLALFLTPQEHQGCSGCKYFYACKGECPGTGESQDWRSRTAHCEMLKTLFDDIEQECITEGLVPISASLMRPVIEARMLQAWENGNYISIAPAINGATATNISHGDAPHGDRAHGDSPHGDSHGDHTDAERK